MWWSNSKRGESQKSLFRGDLVELGAEGSETGVQAGAAVVSGVP